jgi:hypothetical protein
VKAGASKDSIKAPDLAANLKPWAGDGIKAQLANFFEEAKTKQAAGSRVP